VPCQCARHGTTMCQSVVRLADGTTWHNSIIVGWFLLLRKQIFKFGTVRTQKDEKWGIFNITWAGRWFLCFFFLKSHFICTVHVVPCRAYRFERLCHGTNSGYLVPTTLPVMPYNGALCSTVGLQYRIRELEKGLNSPLGCAFLLHRSLSSPPIFIKGPRSL